MELGCKERNVVRTCDTSGDNHVAEEFVTVMNLVLSEKEVQR